MPLDPTHRVITEPSRIMLRSFWDSVVFWTAYNLHQFRQWTKNL